jgi:hypothetical protein
VASSSSPLPQDTRKQRTNAHRRDADPCTLQRRGCKRIARAAEKGDGRDESRRGVSKKNDEKTKEERRGAELIAFFCWPFNVTSEGVWKVGSGMSDEELRAWKELGEEVRCAGFHVR